MKKILPLILCFLVSFSASAQWVVCTMPAVIPYSLTAKNDILIMGTLSSGIYVSADKGNSWTAKNTGISNLQIWSVAAIGDYLYAGTAGGGVFRSSDNGDNWVAINNGISSKTIIRSFAAFGGKLFAASSNQGVYMSNDNGTTWTQHNTGITGLVANPLIATETDLFAGVNQFVYKYDNGSASWTKKNTGMPNATITSFVELKDTQGNKKLFAGLSDYTNMVARSTDNAENWMTVSTDLAKVPVATMCSKSNVIFVGNDYGVYSSSNGGDSWTNASTGFAMSSYATWLAMGTDNLYVIQGGKVWKRPFADFGISTDISEINRSSRATLKQNYPNPLKQFTTIEYTLRASSNVVFSVVDLTGRKVYTEELGTQSTGEYRYTLNALKAGLKSAMYTYVLQTEGGIQTGKMMVE